MSGFIAALKAIGGGGSLLEGARGIIDELYTSKEEQGTQEISRQELELKLTTFLKEHDLAIKEQKAEVEKMYIEDRNEARKMQIAALNQKDRFAKRYVYFLSSFIVIAAFAFGCALMYLDIPEANREVVLQFATVFLFGGAVTVIQFFFGSSKGSQDKDERQNIDKV